MIKKLLQSEFVKNAFTLMGGTVIAMLLPFLISPILARLFTEEDFGLYGLFFSLLTTIVILGTMKYEMAIVAADTDEEAQSLVRISMKVGVGIAVLVSLVFIPFQDFWVDYFDEERLRFWLYLLGPATLIVACYQAYNFWLIRNERFKASATNRITHKAGESAMNVATGFTMAGPGLIIGDIFGRLAALGIAAFQSKKAGLGQLEVKQSEKEIALKYQQYPKYFAGTSFANTISLNMPVIMCSNLFATAIVGYFNLCRQILLAPSTIISRNLGQILLARIAQKRREQVPILKFCILVFFVLLAIAVAMCATILFLGPWLFSFIYGDNWTESGRMAQYLVIPYAIRLVVSPLSMILVALDRIKWQSLWQMTYFAAIAVFYFFREYFQHDVYAFLTGIAILEVAVYLLLLIIVFVQIRHYDQHQLKSL